MSANQKIKLTFLDRKGEYKEASVYVKRASNEVRKQLKKSELELNVHTTNFTKNLADNHKDVFEAQKKTDGDILKALEMHDTITVDEITQVMQLANDLEDKQVEVLIEQMKMIIDIPKSMSSLNLSPEFAEQIETDQGDIYQLEVKAKKRKDEDEPSVSIHEYDFWNNQDLGLLREAKQIFFHWIGI